jgi:pyruvate kinase
MSVESSEEYNRRSKEFYDYYDPEPDIGQAIAKATFFVASDVDAAAIIAPTLRGNTPRMLSKYRPVQHIIAVTTTEQVQRQLLLHWGIVPLISDEVLDSEQMVQNAIRHAQDRGLIGRSDRVVTAAGVPLHSAIPLNTIKVHILGNILVRGGSGLGGITTGRVVRTVDPERDTRRLALDGTEILVTRTIGPDLEQVVAGIAGLVLEESSLISHERIQELNPDIVFISQVPEACQSLEDGITVTLDGDQKIVYEGTIL